ncbi:MAG: coproporphyrinogen III oxidase [Bradymonadia bacterium]
MTDIFDRSAALFANTQQQIIEAIEAIDGSTTFKRDKWQRPENAEGPIMGGHGLTCVLEDGEVFEKAGIGLSVVHGRFSEDFAATMPGDGLDFSACGVSLVFHPRNPHMPTVHMNHRRLSRGNTGWFGGGSDLTPYYLYEEDAKHFHQVLKASCDKHDVADYPKFKKRCDEYFHLPHRNEARGIGGLFFDYMSDAPEDTFAFMQDSCAAFLDAYLPIVERRKDTPYTDAEREWQLQRRGRYVEFNLIHDRGTTFGLKTGGRVESILMSLPNMVSWHYDRWPDEGTPEHALLDVVREPREWA